MRLLLLCLCLCVNLEARELSSASRISLLTCGGGEELYSAFGHSAFRVHDSINGFDSVFNYGTFDFHAPGFYANFVRGKLDYFLSVCEYGYFMYEYRRDRRRVDEQTLDLNAEERQALFDFLIRNSRPENMYYRYDFLFDNCSSRICLALEAALGSKVRFGEYRPARRTTFRNLLYEHLDRMPWSKLGIDLLLGARVDRVPTPRQYTFLPVYLSHAIGGGTIDGRPLVLRSETLYHPKASDSGWLRRHLPLALFSILALAVAVCSLLRLRMRAFDTVFFFTLGLFGCFLVFMWAGTEHYVTKYNLNLLWAFPAHAIAACALLKRRRPRWLTPYFAAAGAVSILMIILWQALPQQLNISLIPIIALAAVRAFAIVNSEGRLIKRLRDVR